MSEDVLSALLTAMAELQLGRSRLENGQQELEHDLGNKHDGLHSELSGLRIDLMARMDRLQNTLATMREDIGVNMRAYNAGS